MRGTRAKFHPSRGTSVDLPGLQASESWLGLTLITVAIMLSTLLVTVAGTPCTQCNLAGWLTSCSRPGNEVQSFSTAQKERLDSTPKPSTLKCNLLFYDWIGGKSEYSIYKKKGAKVSQPFIWAQCNLCCSDEERVVLMAYEFLGIWVHSSFSWGKKQTAC